MSEDLWTVNMLKGPKDCLNPHGSIFVRFFDYSERKSFIIFSAVVLRSLLLLICILALKKQTFVTEINLNFKQQHVLQKKQLH